MANKSRNACQRLCLTIIIIALCDCYQTPTTVQVFLKKPYREQLDLFQALSLENRYLVFVHNMTAREPPGTEFADAMARGGAEVIPFLLNKLKQETYDQNRAAIYQVFDSMAVHHTANISKETINALNQELLRFDIPFYRDMAASSLKMVIEFSKEPTPTKSK